MIVTVKKQWTAVEKKKFKRYRLFFWIGMALFWCGAVLEGIFFGSGGKGAHTGPVFFSDFLPRLFTVETLCYLATFLLGITVYAPCFQLVSLWFRGCFSAYVAVALFLGAEGKSGVLLCFLSIFYLLLSAHLFCAYASFCTQVSLRLFSDPLGEQFRTEEETLFGGTLFNATLFRRSVNFRFLFSYTLFFLLSLALLFVLTLIYACLRSLVG